jgi:hypothetical protein
MRAASVQHEVQGAKATTRNRHRLCTRTTLPTMAPRTCEWRRSHGLFVFRRERGRAAQPVLLEERSHRRMYALVTFAGLFLFATLSRSLGQKARSLQKASPGVGTRDGAAYFFVMYAFGSREEPTVREKNWFQVSPKQRLFWHCSQTDNENGRTQIDSEHVVQVRPCAPLSL